MSDFYGRCSKCDHEWVVAHLPMPLERAAKLMKAAACPKGCDAPVHCGSGKQ